MPSQVTFPIVYGSVLEHLVGRFEVIGLANIHFADFRQIKVAEIAAPIEIGRQLDQLALGHRMVIGFRGAPLDSRRGIFSQLGLDLHHGRCFLRRLIGRIAHQLESARHMLHIFIASCLQLCIVARVVIAIGQTQTALHQLRDNRGRVFEVLAGAETEDGGHAMRVQKGNLIFKA